MMHSTSFPPLASDHGELLVRQAAARNEQAFEALYDSYVPLVYGVARRILGCDNDGVEAVVQTTFMKFWRFAPSYKRGNVAGMLARIARNAAIDVLRKRKITRRRTCDLEDLLTDDSSESYFREVDGTSVRAALALLPYYQRALLELGFFEDLTPEEMTAGRVRRPLGTVKTQIRSGLMNLRRALVSRP